MANEIVYLTRPSSKYESPIFSWAKAGIIGTDEIHIHPTKYLKTPSIWTPIYLRMYLDTDATVANRNMIIRKITLGGIHITLSSVDVAANLTKYMIVSAFDENLMTDVAMGADYTAYMGNVGGMLNSLVLVHNQADNNYLRLSIENGVAGDVWYCWFQFMYMNKLLGLPNVYDESDGWAFERWTNL